MNELWVVRSHGKTSKVGSRIWDAQKHGLERWLWQQPDRWTATGESISRGIHKLVGVMVQRRWKGRIWWQSSLSASLCFWLTWHRGDMGRDEEELSAWANGSMMIVFQMKFRRTYGCVECEGPERLQVRSWQTMVRNWLEMWIWSCEERSGLRMENLDFVLCISVMFGEARESWSEVMWEWAQGS